VFYRGSGRGKGVSWSRCSIAGVLSVTSVPEGEHQRFEQVSHHRYFLVLSLGVLFIHATKQEHSGGGFVQETADCGHTFYDKQGIILFYFFDVNKWSKTAERFVPCNHQGGVFSALGVVR
jgi:hypothetical protein